MDMIKKSPRGSVLDDIDRLIDWNLIHRKLKVILVSRGIGRTPYDWLRMLKIILLQRLYDRSDPEMEHQLYDRISLVDATIIQAQCKPPKGGERSEVDGQAGWTKKNEEYTYGYKAHIGVDEGSGLVVGVQTTSAHVHDSQVIECVVTGEEESVYA
jgi:IS5 family transposase